MSTAEILTSQSVVWIDDDGLLRVRILPGAEHMLEHAQETVAAALTHTGDRRYALLVDLRQIKSLDRHARQFYGSPVVTRFAKAVALLGSSRVTMLIANFFISVTSSEVPTRVFSDEAEALAWLKGYRT